MKIKTLLVAALMFLGLSAAAYAQATYSVGSIPVTAVVRSGNTEKTGDITFTHVSGTSSTPAGTLTISYGVPITVTSASMTVVGNGGYAGMGAGNIIGVNNAAGQVVLSVPTGVATAAPPDSFTLSGVRVAVAGTTLTSLSASISSTGNAITAGQTNVTVINSIAAGIASVGIATASNVNAVSGVITTPTPAIVVTEGFLRGFGVTAATDPTQTISTLVRITLSALPPAGVTITFPDIPASSSGTWARSDAAGALLGAPVTISTANPVLQVWYRVTGDTSTTAIDTLTVSPTIAVLGTATFPLTAASITVTATFAPVLAALTSAGAVPAAPGNAIPRYAAEEVGPATLLNVVGASTTLLVPFATTITSANFNTGLSIANSTTDPGTAAMGMTQAVRQEGRITFYLYPQRPSPTTAAPAPVVYTTTAGSPGTGLDATGSLPTGSTYTVLLSQLLSAAGAPADFSGYVIAITNFTNAHGLYVVSNFLTFSQGSHMLVVNNAAVSRAAPEALNN